jgi:hypothetical protein
MNTWLRCLFLGGCLSLCYVTQGQNTTFQDSIVQVAGIILSKDSLRALPGVSVVVLGTRRGTQTNERGAFGIVALLGQEIEFTSVGYKTQHLLVTSDLQNSQKAFVQIMEVDTQYLASQVIKAYPSKAQFERSFATTKVSDDAQELAMKNLDKTTLRTLSKSVPKTVDESTGRVLRQNSNAAASADQVPDFASVNILPTVAKLLAKKKKKNVYSDSTHSVPEVDSLHAIIPPKDTTLHKQL